MNTRETEIDPETLHQWDVIEKKRAETKTPKQELSLLAGRQASYYYQSHKFKRQIPLDVLTVWADALKIPARMLFLEGDEDPVARLIHLVQQADREKLPQAVRILEAFLTS